MKAFVIPELAKLVRLRALRSFIGNLVPSNLDSRVRGNDKAKRIEELKTWGNFFSSILPLLISSLLFLTACHENLRSPNMAQIVEFDGLAAPEKSRKTIIRQIADCTLWDCYFIEVVVLKLDGKRINFSLNQAMRSARDIPPGKHQLTVHVTAYRKNEDCDANGDKYCTEERHVMYEKEISMDVILAPETYYLGAEPNDRELRVWIENQHGKTVAEHVEGN
jgi:hypothetical protein